MAVVEPMGIPDRVTLTPMVSASSCRAFRQSRHNTGRAICRTTTRYRAFGSHTPRTGTSASIAPTSAMARGEVQSPR